MKSYTIIYYIYESKVGHDNTESNYLSRKPRKGKRRTNGRTLNKNSPNLPFTYYTKAATVLFFHSKKALSIDLVFGPFLLKTYNISFVQHVIKGVFDSLHVITLAGKGLFQILIRLTCFVKNVQVRSVFSCCWLLLTSVANFGKCLELIYNCQIRIVGKTEKEEGHFSNKFHMLLGNWIQIPQIWNRSLYVGQTSIPLVPWPSLATKNIPFKSRATMNYHLWLHGAHLWSQKQFLDQ